MARTVEQRQANTHCSFYTNSDPIRNYMLNRLSLCDGLSVLEPAAGDGAFVEALLGSGVGLDITCIDKDPLAIETLVSRYKNQIEVIKADTILDWSETPNSFTNSEQTNRGFVRLYDRVVGNPPYGGWLCHETRAALKKAFPKYHVRETYSLFILRCLEMLKPSGLLSFIIPDTFLTVSAHKPLREKLLRETEITDVVVMPSKVFPGVAFGYSGLCILTVRKPEFSRNENHKFHFTQVKSAEQLALLSKNEFSGHRSILLQSTLLNRDGLRIWTGDDLIENILSTAKTFLGDIAECKTGIYTGDNSRFICAIDGTSKRTKGYNVLTPSEILTRELSNLEKTIGIGTSASWIPIVKGGQQQFVQTNAWAIDWSIEAVNFYRNDKKARLQNAQYYFRDGLGVPMVSSKRMNAFLLEGRVFDQSVVAIFPKSRAWLYALLLILNSKMATKLLKEGINSTANNSANYLKRLPMPNMSPLELRKVGSIARLIAMKRRKGQLTDTDEQQGEKLVSDLYLR